MVAQRLTRRCARTLRDRDTSDPPDRWRRLFHSMPRRPQMLTLRLSLLPRTLVLAVLANAVLACSPESGDTTTVAAGELSLPDLEALRMPEPVSFTTVYTAPLATEGLTADDAGNLYTAGRAGGSPCPVWRIAAADSAIAVVGTLPPPCSPAGL